MKFTDYMKQRIEESKGSYNPMVKPPQGKETNPYVANAGKDYTKLRVAKDDEKGQSWGEMGGSNVTPADSSLGVPGGQGGVATTTESHKSPYPGGKTDGRIRVTKDKEKGPEWGKMRTPGIDPSTSSLGKEPEAGVGTTTEDKTKSGEAKSFLDETKDMELPEFIEFMLKKKV